MFSQSVLTRCVSLLQGLIYSSSKNGEWIRESNFNFCILNADGSILGFSDETYANSDPKLKKEKNQCHSEGGHSSHFYKHSSTSFGEVPILHETCISVRVAVISAKNHKRQRRKRQPVTAKREKSQTPKVLTAILTLPNLT